MSSGVESGVVVEKKKCSSVRMEKMEEALNKALDMGLEQISIDLLDSYEVFKTREHSASVLGQIRHNLKEKILEDFQEICAKKELSERLERLERLEKQHESGIRQEKAEEPKEKVGRAVIAAKREEVARLQKLLVQLEKEKEELKPVVMDNTATVKQIEELAKDQSKLIDETLVPTYSWMQTDAASWSMGSSFS